MDYNYGQELKSARERSGLSLQAVADALHLDSRLIEAIEGEDETSLPAPAYVRGYIRAYAQLVRCEPDTLIARYNIQARSEPDLAASVHSVAAIKQERDARLVWVGTGIVLSLIMIVIGGWLLIENLFISMPDTAVAPSSPIVADSPLDAPIDSDPLLLQADPALPGPDTGMPSVIEPVNEAPVDTSGLQSQTTAESAPTPAPPAPAAATQESRVSPSAPAQEKEVAMVQEKPVAPEKPVITDAQTGSDRLNLAFDGVSWIEVLDANGERLVYGLFDAQTQPLSVRGQAPFDVTIGDANHVDISVNGQFVSSEPYIRRNNTARFTVESSVQSQ